MSKINALIQTLNRGMISPLALARTDLPRTALSAETQTNYFPRVLGSMMLRPGTKYIDSSNGDQTAVHIPFIFSTEDTAIIELTNEAMRVYVDDEIVQRPSVSTTITNGTFTTDVNGWTDDDEAGATSAWLTGGYLELIGTGFSAAQRYQLVTVGSSGTEHGVTITVERGPVTFRIGTTSSNDDLLTETTLGAGTHSLTFTPTSNFYLHFSSREDYPVLVDSIAIDSSGDMEVAAPWLEADLSNIRYDQSADVIYVACDGYQQYKIERRSETSWSIVKYEPLNGPFRLINTSNISIASSGLTGSVTLTASKPLFTEDNVGSLYKIISLGQNVSLSATGADQFTGYIKVIGTGTQRNVTLTISGSWSATVTLQRSVSEPGAWVDVTTYTTNQASITYNDALDNQIMYYRIGIKTGNYTSGTAVLSLSYSSGSLTGIVKVTAFTSSTSVSAIVLTALGATTASTEWSEGVWSARRGYPTCVVLYEGRLWWAGRDKILGSESDSYESFDEDTEGDSGPINRSIGRGPVDIINWMLPLQRLIIGTQGSEFSVKATTFDEPLTPTNFNIKDPSSQGSTSVAAIKIDNKGIFVQRSGQSVFEMAYSIQSEDYESNELTTLVPEIGNPSIIRLAAQRQPDTRVHCVRSDGKVAILVYDPAEEVRCWILYETDGTVEDAVVIPGEEEDNVYYLVNRTINGSTKRYLEKFALESECQGETLNKQADSFIIYSGASTTTITGLSHLEGEQVIVWGDGIDYSPDNSSGVQQKYTVSGGSITLTTAVQNAIIGLPYDGEYKSTKLAYGAQLGTALTMRKIVDKIGLLLYNTHAKGVKYGPDFDTLDDLPDIEDETAVDYDTIHENYDQEMIEFDGEYDTDSRVCLRSRAPRPCTVLGIVIGIKTNEKK